MNSRELATAPDFFSNNPWVSLWTWMWRPLLRSYCKRVGHDLVLHDTGESHDSRCGWAILDEQWVTCRRCIGHFKVSYKEWHNGHRTNQANSGGQAGAIAPAPGTLYSVPFPHAGASPRPKLEPVAEEIIANRAWFCALQCDGSVVLCSLTRNVAWEWPTLVAEGPVGYDSSCGIYAVKGVVNYAHTVSGTVALSGIVVEGENGYRAERATIRSLVLHYKRLGDDFSDRSPLQIAAELEERYQGDVELNGAEPTPSHQMTQQQSQQSLANALLSGGLGGLFSK